MMVTRGVVCGKCRHRLSIPTTNSTEVKCPTCNKMNPIPTYVQFGNKDRSIEKLIVKAKEKISGNDLISSKKPDSLNKKPCPLNIPGSSSSETRPAGKRALLIGVTYKRKHKLKGTINDVKSMRELLILNFGFKEENILVLTGIIIVIPSLIFCSHFLFIALLMSENLPFDTHMLVHGMQSNL